MGSERRFDLLCGNVLAAPDDDVLEPIDDREVFAVEDGEIAGSEPAAVHERDFVERAIEITTEHLRTTDEQLAGLSPRHVDERFRIDDAELALGDEPAVGCGVAFGIIAGAAGRERRILGRSVRPLAPAVEARGTLAHHLRCDAGAAERKEP